MPSHRCGEDCTTCQRAIDARETEQTAPASYDGGEWQPGQDAYERDLDQLGGSL